MKTKLFVIILTLGLVGIASAQPVTWMDNFIDSVMEAYHIPGAATLAFKNGQTIWTGYYGHANIANDIPVTDSTLFTLASVSKTITATAVMQLCEDSLFSLDDDINDYLPFEVHNPWFPRSIITFRMLLAHTSSLRDNFNVLGPLQVPGDSPIPIGQFVEDYFVPGGLYYDENMNFNLSWAPGTYWEYCNVSVTLLAYLVEVINPDSLSFDQYCDEYLFAPLSMNATSWFLADLDTSHIATPYSWNGMTYQPLVLVGWPIYPAALLKTSAPQLARHLKAWGEFGQVDSVRILDSATVVEMRTIQYPQINPEYGLIWRYHFACGFWHWCHSGIMAGVGTNNSFCEDENWGAILLANAYADPAIVLIMTQLSGYASDYTSLACDLTPTSTPIVIPPGGGSFGYSVEIENQTDSAAVFAVWIDLTLPSGATVGPIILRQNVNLSAYASLLRQLAQTIPARAPAGDYSYNAYAGDYPQYVWSLDYFAFTKETSIGDQAGTADLEWLLSGWEETAEADVVITPALTELQARPNPFNLTTVLRFELQDVGFVTLRIFDTAGRLVTELVNGRRDAGMHEATFDGSGLPSGIYFAKLTAGDYSQVQKLVLIK